MVLVVTRDAKLALKVNKVVKGKKSFLVREVGETELRHVAHSHQPRVIILDVRFGGNKYRVMEQVPSLQIVRSQPAIIVLTPWQSKEVSELAATLSCFDVVPTSSRLFASDLSQSVKEALAAHLAGLLQQPSEHDHQLLH